MKYAHFSTKAKWFKDRARCSAERVGRHYEVGQSTLEHFRLGDPQHGRPIFCIGGQLP